MKNVNIFLQTLQHLTFRLPTRHAVLLYDECHADLLRSQYPGLRFTILNVRLEKFFLGILILSVLEPLFWRRQLYSAYKIAFIRYCRPRVVITLIDNHEFFYRIRHYLPRLTTIFIQASRRSATNDIFSFLKPDPQYRVDHMFVHNSAIGSHYQKYIAGDTVLLGSFKNNLYSPQYNKSLLPYPPVDILFISQWRPRDNFQCVDSEGQHIPYDIAYQPDIAVFQLLLAFCSQNNLTVGVLPVQLSQSPTTSEERAFYHAAAKSQSFSFSPSTTRSDSYFRLRKCRLVVTLTSTLGLEAFSLGQRTLFVNCRASILQTDSWRFGWPLELPDNGPFWVNTVSPDTISSSLHTIINYTDMAWTNICQEYTDNILVYNPRNMPLTKVLTQYIPEQDLFKS